MRPVSGYTVSCVQRIQTQDSVKPQYTLKRSTLVPTHKCDSNCVITNHIVVWQRATLKIDVGWNAQNASCIVVSRVITRVWRQVWHQGVSLCDLSAPVLTLVVAH